MLLLLMLVGGMGWVGRGGARPYHHRAPL